MERSFGGWGKSYLIFLSTCIGFLSGYLYIYIFMSKHEPRKKCLIYKKVKMWPFLLGSEFQFYDLISSYSFFIWILTHKPEIYNSWELYQYFSTVFWIADKRSHLYFYTTIRYQFWYILCQGLYSCKSSWSRVQPQKYFSPETVNWVYEEIETFCSHKARSLFEPLQKLLMSLKAFPIENHMESDSIS